MNILVVGSGGREHAIIKKLKEGREDLKIFAIPGNGGIAADAVCLSEISAKDIDAIADFAEMNRIDFAVVAPDDPLVLGAVDKLHEKGIPCFGPDKKAARIEGSKVFAKMLMKKYNIPTASYEVFDNADDALSCIKTSKLPIVIKADGLALGKGVFICNDLASAEKAVKEIMLNKIFGDSGNKVVIEEYLTGPEVSVLCFTDGKTIVPMVSSMDHKRALDGDEGLNTGGMGTIAPNPYFTEEVAKECMEKIFMPTINAMNAEDSKFKGCLYFGLMLTENGPKVIEYNCRFGDPETQVVLPLLKTDLLDIMIATENECLDSVNVEFSNGSACCVVIASGGYPQKYNTGYEIKIDEASIADNISIFHAGTKLVDGKTVTSSGRVLGVTAVADSLKEAIDDAYKACSYINFTDCYYRKDIGKRALEA